MKTKRRKLRAAPVKKFVQIMSTDSPAGTEAVWLLALDEGGDVWIYLGAAKGWKILNMKRMGPRTMALDTAAWLRRGRRDPSELDWDGN